MAAPTGHRIDVTRLYAQAYEQPRRHAAIPLISTHIHLATALPAPISADIYGTNHRSTYIKSDGYLFVHVMMIFKLVKRKKGSPQVLAQLYLKKIEHRRPSETDALLLKYHSVDDRKSSQRKYKYKMYNTYDKKAIFRRFLANLQENDRKKQA